MKRINKLAYSHNFSQWKISGNQFSGRDFDLLTEVMTQLVLKLS